MPNLEELKVEFNNEIIGRVFAKIEWENILQTFPSFLEDKTFKKVYPKKVEDARDRLKIKPEEPLPDVEIYKILHGLNKVNGDSIIDNLLKIHTELNEVSGASSQNLEAYKKKITPIINDNLGWLNPNPDPNDKKTKKKKKKTEVVPPEHSRTWEILQAHLTKLDGLIATAQAEEERVRKVEADKKKLTEELRLKAQREKLEKEQTLKTQREKLEEEQRLKAQREKLEEEQRLKAQREKLEEEQRLKAEADKKIKELEDERLRLETEKKKLDEERKQEEGEKENKSPADSIFDFQPKPTEANTKGKPRVLPDLNSLSDDEESTNTGIPGGSNGSNEKPAIQQPNTTHPTVTTPVEMPKEKTPVEGSAETESVEEKADETTTVEAKPFKPTQEQEDASAALKRYAKELRDSDWLSWLLLRFNYVRLKEHKARELDDLSKKIRNMPPSEGKDYTEAVKLKRDSDSKLIEGCFWHGGFWHRGSYSKNLLDNIIDHHPEKYTKKLGK